MDVNTARITGITRAIFDKKAELDDIQDSFAEVLEALEQLKQRVERSFGADDELTLRAEDFWWQAKRWADRTTCGLHLRKLRSSN